MAGEQGSDGCHACTGAYRPDALGLAVSGAVYERHVYAKQICSMGELLRLRATRHVPAESTTHMADAPAAMATSRMPTMLLWLSWA